MAKYDSLYARLVASTEEPENSNSCWLWKGVLSKDSGYPRLAIRVPGRAHPVQVAAHRKVLEEAHGVLFPFDEAGHLCYNRNCINPDHLEVQTKSFNNGDRRNSSNAHGCCIPTLFPIEDPLQSAADRAWDGPHEVSSTCPF